MCTPFNWPFQFPSTGYCSHYSCCLGSLWLIWLCCHPTAPACSCVLSQRSHNSEIMCVHYLCSRMTQLAFVTLRIFPYWWWWIAAYPAQPSSFYNKNTFSSIVVHNFIISRKPADQDCVSPAISDSSTHSPILQTYEISGTTVWVLVLQNDIICTRQFTEDCYTMQWTSLLLLFTVRPALTLLFQTQIPQWS